MKQKTGRVLAAAVTLTVLFSVLSGINAFAYVSSWSGYGYQMPDNAAEIISNGGFEIDGTGSNPANWSLSGGGVVVGSEDEVYTASPDGGDYVKLDPGSGTAWCISENIAYDYNPNTVYELSVWYKTSVTASTKYSIVPKDAGGTVIANTAYSGGLTKVRTLILTSGEWKKFTYYISTPENCKFLSISYQGGNGGGLCIDGFSLKELVPGTSGSLLFDPDLTKPFASFTWQTNGIWTLSGAPAMPVWSDGEGTNGYYSINYTDSYTVEPKLYQKVEYNSAKRYKVTVRYRAAVAGAGARIVLDYTGGTTNAAQQIATFTAPEKDKWYVSSFYTNDNSASDSSFISVWLRTTKNTGAVDFDMAALEEADTEALLFNSTGQEISTFGAGESITAKCTVSEATTNGVLFVFATYKIYGNEKSLTDVKIKTETAGTVGSELSITAPSEAGTYSIEAYCWSTDGNITPLAGKKAITGTIN